MSYFAYLIRGITTKEAEDLSYARSAANAGCSCLQTIGSSITIHWDKGQY